jgi:hypothetical protein
MMTPILRVSTIVSVWLVLAAAAPGPQRAAQFTFDGEPVGAAPKDFAFAAMRQSEPGTWEVRQAAKNGFLAHLIQRGSHGYAMAIAPGSDLRDLAVSARLRLTDGALSGGVISRYVDAKNYYATVLDLRRGQLRMYRIFDGNRNQIEFKDDLQLDFASWHTLKVVHHDNFVSAYLGGIKVFEDRDNRNRAFAAGRCGVLASGDSEVWFDDLSIETAGRIHTITP